VIFYGETWSILQTAWYNAMPKGNLYHKYRLLSGWYLDLSRSFNTIWNVIQPLLISLSLLKQRYA